MKSRIDIKNEYLDAKKNYVRSVNIIMRIVVMAISDDGIIGGRYEKFFDCYDPYYVCKLLKDIDFWKDKQETLFTLYNVINEEEAEEQCTIE